MKLTLPAGLKQPENGLTLIEMLIAFALLGLVTAALYSFYLSGLQAWNRSVERMENQQTARIAMNKMIDELQYAHLVKCCIDEDACRSCMPGDIIYFRINVNGVSARHSFRLCGSQLLFDRRRNHDNAVIYTSVVALGLTGLEFMIDETNTVFIMVRAGEGPAAATLAGALRPRNIPRIDADQNQDENGGDGD